MLIGGESRRFGSPKELVALDGVPMAERVASVLSEAGCAPVAFVGARPASRAALADMSNERASGIARRPFIADRWPGAGPLGGVLSALLGLHQPVVVAACDLADLRIAAVRALVDVDGGDVVFAVAEGRRRPLALWRRSALGPVLAAFDGGERSLLGPWLEQSGLEVRAVTVPRGAVTDHNTPDRLRSQGRLDRSGRVEP